MKNKLMLIGLAAMGAGLNASEGVKTMLNAQDAVTPTYYTQFTSACSNGYKSTKSFGSSILESKYVATPTSYVVAAGKSVLESKYVTTPTSYVVAGGSYVATNVAKGWNAEIRGYKHGGKVAICGTAAGVTVAGLTFAAYKKGYFARLNPFGKVAAVEEAPVVAEEAPVVAVVETPVIAVVEAPVVKQEVRTVTAPVVMKKRQFNKPRIWNAKTQMYQKTR